MKVNVETGSRSFGLTVSPAMYMGTLQKRYSPIIRINIYFWSVYLFPNIRWVEEPGHGSWTRSYGFFLWNGALTLTWGANRKRYLLW